MSNPQSIRRFLLCALGCAAMFGAFSGVAAAAGYGELERFGEQGTGKGAFTLSYETNAFGVDPTNDTVYVGDTPTKEGKYRIQELQRNPEGKWEAVASVSFVPKHHLGIEGIAVDPAKQRIYVLAVYEREEETALDESEAAAGSIYAFSTAEAKKLVAIDGPSVEDKELGVLAGPGTLHAQGEGFGEALLEPSGITVDPTTGDVIVLGQVEESGEVRHTALQRIGANGEAGARWVDPTAEEEEEAGGDNSPVVSTTGQVYYQQFDQVVQVPKSFAAADPTPIFSLVEPETSSLLATDTGRAESLYGGGLSFSPEGALYAGVQIQEAEGSYYEGALALSYSESGEKGAASEFGWTGGGSVAHGAQCVIGFSGPTRPQLAAGKEHQVFMLDSSVDQVIEFGPEGKGCPTASASAPVATASGKTVSEVQAGTTVKLSSTVTQANALSVEWDFGEGEAPQVVATNEHRITEIMHKFAKTSTVTETIHTDDLATPTIKVQVTITVSPASPTASFSAPSSALVGQSVELNAKNSSDPNKSPIKEYSWSFGDGQHETTTQPVVHHTYSSSGKQEVELTITDELGLKATHTLAINIENQPSQGTKTTTTATTESTPTTPPPPSPTPPDAQIAGTALGASSSGAVSVKVSCPAGESTCSGTVTLRTLGAVSASVARGAKKSILTLAGGSFTVAGGAVKTITLHLSGKARALLARVHVLRVRATIVAHDPTGATHTTVATVTLHALKAKRRR
jgi:PKD domain